MADSNNNIVEQRGGGTPWDFSTIRSYANELTLDEENPLENALQIASDLSVAVQIMRSGNQLPEDSQILRRFTQAAIRSLAAIENKANPAEVQKALDKVVGEIKASIQPQS